MIEGSKVPASETFVREELSKTFINSETRGRVTFQDYCGDMLDVMTELALESFRRRATPFSKRRQAEKKMQDKIAWAREQGVNKFEAQLAASLGTRIYDKWMGYSKPKWTPGFADTAQDPSQFLEDGSHRHD